jgi:hypothetical protein
MLKQELAKEQTPSRHDSCIFLTVRLKDTLYNETIE